MVIDSHTHLNKTDDETDFSDGVARLILTAKKNNIEKIVIIGNTISGTNCASTKEILESINDDLFYVIGSPNITDTSKSDIPYYDDLLKNHKIIGLKLFPGHERFYPTDKICQSVYKLALKYDCPVVFHTGINSGNLDCAKYNNPKFIVEVAKKYPNIKIIIAHYFWPRMDYCFEITKDIPNIYYDTSAMADYEVVGLSGGLEKVADILEKTAKIKPHSIIFGSDFDMCDQKAHIELIQKLMLSSIAKDDIFSNNFKKCFGNAVK